MDARPRHAPRTHRRLASWAVLAGLSLTGAACGSARAVDLVRTVSPPVVVPTGAQVVRVSPPPPAPACGDPTASIAPPVSMPQPGSMPADSFMAGIAARGYLLAGVDQNTYLWGYRDPTTGQLTGFDIDVLRQVSQAIFGDPDRIHFVIVPNSLRVQAVQTGEVDIVAETMTINCSREKSVDFSSVYFEAGQQILVPSGSSISGPNDLGGKRVCAAQGSTSLMNLAALAVTPKVVTWAVENEADCLVLLQQGQVDAISTDNTILQGLAAQDPNTKLVGQTFSQEPYGLAVSKSHPEFTSFVNGVLAEMRADGTWAAIYSRWLAPNNGGVVPAPPPASYRTAP